MKHIEHFLVKLDDGPSSAVSRVALGFCIPLVLRALTGGQDHIWTSLALFLGLLIALRVIPAVLRMLLPFSAEAKGIWLQRRQIAKRHDSYQWQKLFWMGIGLLAFAAIGGGLRTGELAVTLVCLVGGSAGMMFWRRSGAVQVPAGA
ncbi:MAG: hypothetical protein AB7I42_13270 [Bradyrhizobium sp.]|uniref:hypothetical protein n=1 Tax=Bradyrhizobium sp. TaxID=376 RepID=UPI002A2D930B|nr:hypothetical protein [Bradyrhizobium sp.]